MAKKRIPPGPKGWPIVGMAPMFFKNVMEYIKVLPQHGDVVQVKLAGMTFIYILHPDGVEHVLVKARENYTKGKLFERSKLLFGEGLVASEGELWKKQRKRMAPAFQPKHVDSFRDAIAISSAESIDAYQDGGIKYIDTEMMALTLEIALRILFGTSSGSDVTVVGEAFTEISEYFASATGGFLPIPMWVPTPGNLRFKKAYNKMEQVVTRILHERQAQAEPGTDLLGLLLACDEEEEPMAEQQLRDEIRTLLLAGHETTALGLTYAIWFLSGDPALQDAVFDEVSALTKGGRVEGSHYEDLTLCHQIFKESMRLLPPAPVTTRSPIHDDEIGGYDIPAGSTLIISMILTQRDPRWFNNPEEFLPERWTPEFEKSLPRFAYFPFGGGPRICIGQRMAMIEGILALAELLRRFRIERVEEELPKLIPSITLRPSRPIPFRLVPR